MHWMYFHVFLTAVFLPAALLTDISEIKIAILQLIIITKHDNCQINDALSTFTTLTRTWGSTNEHKLEFAPCRSSNLTLKHF